MTNKEATTNVYTNFIANCVMCGSVVQTIDGVEQPHVCSVEVP